VTKRKGGEMDEQFRKNLDIHQTGPAKRSEQVLKKDGSKPKGSRGPMRRERHVAYQQANYTVIIFKGSP